MVTCQPSDTNYPNPFRGAIPPIKKPMAKKEDAAIAGKAGKTAKKREYNISRLARELYRLQIYWFTASKDSFSPYTLCRAQADNSARRIKARRTKVVIA